MADDPRRASLPPEDLQFAELAVGQGICSREAVDECLSFLGRLLVEGVTPLPRLGELLVRKGHLSADRLNATVRPAASGGELDRLRDLPPEVAQAAADPANNFGKYVKADRLGAGGMGEVWRGWDRELRRWVALKFLHDQDPGQLARFRREAQTAAALNHPHIASVYEVGDAKGRPFIAMQHIAGVTLDTVPRNNPRLLVELVRDAALAIHYAHEQGVIHRDLKPANLMVESAGGRARIYVMDFGLAKPTAIDSSLSISGQVLGTPAYMAPEQARGESTLVSARSDVYALGATLYELFADRPPFHATEVYALLQKVVDEDPVPLRRRSPRVDRDLETIVMKCLEKDPDRRYASAREFAEDLGRWLDGGAITAHPPSAGYKLRKFAGRHKALLGVGSAGLALAAILLAATLREKSEKEALRELGELRAKMLQVKEWIRQDFRSSGEIRIALDQETGRLSEFLARHPRLPQALYVRSQGLLLQGRLEDAEADLREAVRLEPRFAPGWALLSRVKLERYSRRLYGDPTADPSPVVKRAAPLLRSAQEDFRKGWTEQSAGGDLAAWGLLRVTEDAVNERLLQAFQRYYLQEDREAGRKMLEDAFRQAPSEEYCRWIAIWTSDPEDHLKWLEKATHIAPHSALVRADIACLRYQRREWDTAVAEATRALEVNPRSSVAFCVRGSAWLEKGDLNRCIEDSTRAAEGDDQFAVPFATRAAARLLLGDFNGARQDATRALEIDPQYPLAFANRAGASISLGDGESGLKDCDRALALDPEHVVALTNRAGAQLLLGNMDAALKDATRAIQLKPSYALAWINRGSAHLRKDELDEAEADYRHGLDADPRLTLGYVNLAGLYLFQDRWYDAIYICERAIEGHPEAALAWSNLSCALEEIGDLAAAVADATKAIELAPAIKEPYLVRARAREALHDRAGAIADYEQALKLAPADWPSRADIEQELKAIRESR